MNLYVSVCMKQINYYLVNATHLTGTTERKRRINNVIIITINQNEVFI